MCLSALALARPGAAAELSLDAPPVGYVGPVEREETLPPAGYTGPVTRAAPALATSDDVALPARAKKKSAAAVDVTMPPVGYTGPVGTGGGAVQTAPAASVAPAVLKPAPAVAAKVGPISVNTLMPPVGYVGPVASVAGARAEPVAVDEEAGTPPVKAVEPQPAEVKAATGKAAPSKAESKADKKMAGGKGGKAAKDDQDNPEGLTPEQLKARRSEILISAREMRSDDAHGLTIAEGKVEIVRGDNVLHADRVTYDKNTGVMTADGHVTLMLPSGEVEFAEHQEITGDMKQAFARNLGVLFPDNSRMAAKTAQRYDERYMVADRAAFTACNVCKENPDNPPLWQLRANSVTHDKEAQEIYYHDATVDFWGVPVFYTPYMSTPDPTVTRRQGFLAPTPGYSSSIGAFVRTPYYFDLAPDKDMTVAPTFSETDGAQMAMQYRERFANGALKFDGSFTRTTLLDDSGANMGEQWRGDMMGNFRYDLSPVWRAGTDFGYVSDKSYLHRYNISSTDQLVNRAYVEGFMGRNYAAVNSYAFEDLRPDVNAAQPYVLPSATFSALGRPGETLGGRWSFDASTLATLRENGSKALTDQGPDTRRLSMSGGWQRQFVSDTGLVTTTSGLLRTDSYWADHVVSADGGVYDHALFTRPFGQGNVTVRYPMGRSGNGYQQLLEPIVSMTAAPTMRSIAKQPIEDSYAVEFDETNLFSANRFTGNDLLDDGSRVTYGLRNAVTTDDGARIDMFGGQSYSFTPSQQFPEDSGLRTHASDYVGRIDFAPVKWFNANYGFRLAEADLSPQRQDAIVSVGVPEFRPWARYIEAYQTDTSTGLSSQVRQITGGFSSKFARYWTFHATHTQAFDPQPGPRTTEAGIAYVDECYAFGMSASHDFTTRADISTGTSVIFHFYLKNLGGINTDSPGAIQFPAEFRDTN